MQIKQQFKILVKIYKLYQKITKIHKKNAKTFNKIKMKTIFFLKYSKH